MPPDGSCKAGGEGVDFAGARASASSSIFEMERRGLDRIGLGVQTYRPGGWDEAFEVNSSPLKAGVIRADRHCNARSGSRPPSLRFCVPKVDARGQRPDEHGFSPCQFS